MARCSEGSTAVFIDIEYSIYNIAVVTVCRRLSRVFICLFGSVGSFRVRVFVVDVFVTSGKMATAVL